MSDSVKYILTVSLLIACSWAFGQEITPAILRKINATEFKHDENNGDGVFLAKNLFIIY